MSRTFKIQLVAAAVAFALVAVMVVRTSTAVFTGTTDTAGSWDAGTVALSDDDGGSATFTATDLRPGDSGQECIQVDYDGSLVGADLHANGVVVYSAVTDNDNPANSPAQTLAEAGLSDNLQLTVELLNDTDYTALSALGDDCAAWTSANADDTVVFTTAAANTMGTDFTTGEYNATTPWVPSSNADLRHYRIAWSLPIATDDDAQGDGTDITFTWETQTVGS